MHESDNKIRTLEKYGTLILVLAPMLSQYYIFSHSIILPELLLAPLLVLSLCMKQKKLMFNRNIVIYLFAAIFLSCINIFIRSTFDINILITSFIRYIYYFMVIIFITKNFFNFDLGIKILMAVATLNSIYGLLQYFIYYLYKIALPWYLPFFGIKSGGKLIEFQDNYFESFGYRFSGLFSEPAQLALYIGVALVTLIFYNLDHLKYSKLKKGILISLYSITMLLSGAGAGAGLLVFIIGMYVIRMFIKKRKKIKDWVYAVTLTPVALSCILYMYHTPFLSKGFERITKISETSTLNIRVLRPFKIFIDLPFVHKLIGVGYANYSSYVLNSSLAINYEIITGAAWTNSLAFVLVGTGLLGFFIYLLIFYRFYKVSTEFSKIMIIFLMAVGLYSSAHHSLTFVTIMSFVSAGVNKKVFLKV